MTQHCSAARLLGDRAGAVRRAERQRSRHPALVPAVGRLAVGAELGWRRGPLRPVLRRAAARAGRGRVAAREAVQGAGDVRKAGALLRGASGPRSPALCSASPAGKLGPVSSLAKVSRAEHAPVRCGVHARPCQFGPGTEEPHIALHGAPGDRDEKVWLGVSGGQWDSVLGACTCIMCCQAFFANGILESYVSILMQEKRISLIATYATFLPQCVQVECYSGFLQGYFLHP